MQVTDSDFEYVEGLVSPWIDQYFEHGPGVLAPDELIGVGVWMLEAQVNNGGFDQYYFNSAGNLAVPTVSALTQIGARNTASLLAAANAEFPDSLPPADRNTRQELLEQISETARFGALDQLFYQNAEDLTGLLAKFFRERS